MMGQDESDDERENMPSSHGEISSSQAPTGFQDKSGNGARSKTSQRPPLLRLSATEDERFSLLELASSSPLTGIAMGFMDRNQGITVPFSEGPTVCVQTRSITSTGQDYITTRSIPILQPAHAQTATSLSSVELPKISVSCHHSDEPPSDVDRAATSPPSPKLTKLQGSPLPDRPLNLTHPTPTSLQTHALHSKKTAVPFIFRHKILKYLDPDSMSAPRRHSDSILPKEPEDLSCKARSFSAGDTIPSSQEMPMEVVCSESTTATNIKGSGEEITSKSLKPKKNLQERYLSESSPSEQSPPPTSNVPDVRQRRELSEIPRLSRPSPINLVKSEPLSPYISDIDCETDTPVFFSPGYFGTSSFFSPIPRHPIDGGSNIFQFRPLHLSSNRPPPQELEWQLSGATASARVDVQSRSSSAITGNASLDNRICEESEGVEARTEGMPSLLRDDNQIILHTSNQVPPSSSTGMFVSPLWGSQYGCSSVPGQKGAGGPSSWNLLTGGVPGGEPSSYTCPVCGQVLSTYDHLAKHMVSHLPSEVVQRGGEGGSKVHVCKVCNRSFSRSDMLTRHLRLHTGMKPYECHVCEQVFSRSDHLHTHLRTHTGEKPYKCPDCSYAAPRRDMITRHRRIHQKHCSRRGRRGGVSAIPSSLRQSSLSSVSSVESDDRRHLSLSSAEDSLEIVEQQRLGSSTSSEGDPQLPTWSSASLDSLESCEEGCRHYSASTEGSVPSPRPPRPPRHLGDELFTTMKGSSLEEDESSLSPGLQSDLQRCNVRSDSTSSSSPHSGTSTISPVSTTLSPASQLGEES